MADWAQAGGRGGREGRGREGGGGRGGGRGGGMPQCLSRGMHGLASTSVVSALDMLASTRLHPPGTIAAFAWVRGCMPASGMAAEQLLPALQLIPALKQAISLKLLPSPATLLVMYCTLSLSHLQGPNFTDEPLSPAGHTQCQPSTRTSRAC